MLSFKFGTVMPPRFAVTPYVFYGIIAKSAPDFLGSPAFLLYILYVYREVRYG